MMRALIVAVLVLSVPAFAGGPCGGYMTSQWLPQPDVIPQAALAVDVDLPGGGGGGGADSGGDFGGDLLGAALGDTRVFLIVAAIAIAAMPLFIYSLDSEAQDDVMHCWAQPTEAFQLYGGGISGAGLSTGYMGMRGEVTFGFLGLQASGETSPLLYSDVGAAFALRAPPRQHVELALAFGARQITSPYSRVAWLELSLPHRYLPFRTDAFNPGVGLELRPALLWSGTTLDARIDAGIVVPFGPWMTTTLGARIYSFATGYRVGAQLGFLVNV